MRIWSDQICPNPQFKQKKITCQEAKQQRTCLPEFALFLSSRNLYRFILCGHFIWHTVQMGRNVESVFGKSRASARSLRAGMEGQRASPCDTETNQAGDELCFIPAGILPGSQPCLFWAAESIWCMAWTIRFRLWTLGMLFLCDTWSGMKDDGKEWMVVHSTAYCTSPLGDILVNPHKCCSSIQLCFLRHLPNPLLSLLNQQRIV